MARRRSSRRTRNQTRNRWLAVLGTLAAIVVLLVAFFPRQKLVAMAVARLESATGRPVRVGSSSLDLIPRLQLDLAQVTSGEKAEPGAPKIEIEGVHAGLRWMPLLTRKVVISEIVIDHPRFEMVLSDSQRAPTKVAPKGASSGLAVQVQHLEIKNADIVVRRADREPLVEIHGLNEVLQLALDPKGHITIGGTTTAPGLALYLPAGKFGDGLDLVLEKRLTFDPQADRLGIDQASLRAAGLPVSVKGTIDGIRSKKMIAALDLEGGPGDVATIAGLLPAGLVPQASGVSSSGKLQVTGRIEGPLAPSPGPDFDIAVRLEDGRIQAPGKSPVSDIRLNLRLTPDTLTVEEMQARTAASFVQAHATVSSYRTAPRMRAAVQGDVALEDATLMNPELARFDLGGRVVAQVLAEGPASDPNALEVNGTLTAKNVTTRVPNIAVPLTNLTGDVVFDRHTASTKNLTGRAGSGTLRVSGVLTNPLALNPRFADKGRARLVADASGDLLDMNELRPPPGAPGGPPLGAPRQPLPPLPPLDGLVNVSLDRFVMRKLDGRAGRGQLALENGILAMQGVSLQTFGGAVQLAGNVDLTNMAAPRFDLTTKATDCHITDLFAYNEALERFSGVASFLRGTISSSATMRGALNDTFGIDLPTLLSQGDVQVRQATLEGHPAQAALARFLDAQGLTKLTVLELLQPFKIENGRLNLERISLKSQDIEVGGSGWSDLTGAYALTLDLVLPPSWAQGLRKQIPADLASVVFASDTGRLVVPVTIEGKGRSDPSIKVDTQRLAEGARQQVASRLEEERKKLEEDLKKRAAEAAKKLLETKTDTTTATGAAKQEVEDKVKGALEDLFKKKGR